MLAFCALSSRTIYQSWENIFSYILSSIWNWFEICNEIAAQFHVFRYGDSIVTAQLLKSLLCSTAFTINQASVYEWFFPGSVCTHWLACLGLWQECVVLWVLETCGTGPSTCVPVLCLEDILVYAFSKNILGCSYQCAPGKM